MKFKQVKSEIRPDNFYEDCVNGNIDVNLLIHYSFSDNVQIRSDVAKASNCPEDILEKLAHDPENIVRFHVAGNLKTPIRILRILGQDKADAVKSHVMTNPNCPYDLRKTLMEDEHCKWFVAEIPDLNEDEIREYFNLDYRTKELMCYRQKLPDDIIEEIISENDEQLIKKLRYNKHLTGHPLLTKKEG